MLAAVIAVQGAGASRLGSSLRRAEAMVRCAFDLGLRSGEVARLGLDDIAWLTGTVTLLRTKGRREDVMPLPDSTGQAIAAYLFEERPQTRHGMVFAICSLGRLGRRLHERSGQLLPRWVIEYCGLPSRDSLLAINFTLFSPERR